MRFKFALPLLLVPLMLAGCAMAPREAPISSPLLGEKYGASPDVARTLYVVVHGEGERTDTDSATFARALAATEPGSAVVRLIRPGYADGLNGDPNAPGQLEVGETYDNARLAAVVDAFAVLRNRYRSARVVAIGEAGGAIVVANLAGLKPSLVDGIVLVSCPCALPEWRTYIAKREPNDRRWQHPEAGLDPLKTAGGIRGDLRAAILIGGDDRRVPARFSRSYAEALSLRGIATDFRILPGRSAPVLDDPQVIEASRRLAAALTLTARQGPQ